jgi:hypothetical protein
LDERRRPTIRIPGQPDDAELHPSASYRETSYERLADPEDQLDRLGRLDGSDDTGKHAEHAPSAQLGMSPAWRRRDAGIDVRARSRRTSTPVLEARDAAAYAFGRPRSTQASLTRYRVGKLSVPPTITSHAETRSSALCSLEPTSCAIRVGLISAVDRTPNRVRSPDVGRAG